MTDNNHFSFTATRGTSILATPRSVLKRIEAEHVLVVLIAIFFLCSRLLIIWSLAPTADEWTHREYGIKVLKAEPQRISLAFDSKSPVSALNALPYETGSLLQHLGASQRIVSVLQDIRTSRLPTVLISLALGFLVYSVAREFYGSVCGVFAFALYSLSPNLIAHGSLCTTDMPFAAEAFAALVCFRSWLAKPSMRNAFGVSLCLALALLTKFAALILMPVMVVYACAQYLSTQRQPLQPCTGTYVFPTNQVSAGRIALLCVAIVTTFLAISNVAFSFTGSGTRLRDYHFRTSLFQHLQGLALLRAVPIPVPTSVLDGLDMTKYNETVGHTFDDIYFLGEVRKYDRVHGVPPKPFPAYYVVLSFYKEAIPILILFALGTIYLLSRKPFTSLLRDEGIFVLFVVTLVGFLSFFNSAQIGVRHALPLFVLATLIASAALKALEAYVHPHQSAIAAALLTCALILCDSRRFPDYISYSNEFAGGPSGAYRLMADSNLNWGQGDWIVQDFLRKNPDVVVNPAKPVRRRVLVDANSLCGIDNWQPRHYGWLRGRTPRNIGYTYLFFEVK